MSKKFRSYLPHSGFQLELSGVLLKLLQEVLLTILIGILSEADSSENFGLP